MAKTMRVGWLGRAALAATVAVALVQAPAHAETAAAGTLGVPFANGSVQDGATKSVVCGSCHGPNGNSANPEWPRTRRTERRVHRRAAAAVQGRHTR